MGVYSDAQHTAIELLARKRDQLPLFDYIGGDFNVHSRIWDPNRCRDHQTTAISLLDTAAALGTELAQFANPGFTHKPHNPDLRDLIIDLVFIPGSEILTSPIVREMWLQGPSDHVPLLVVIDVGREIPFHPNAAIKKDSEIEKDYITMITEHVRDIDPTEPTTPNEVEAMADALASTFERAWNCYAAAPESCRRSKSWWDADCKNTLKAYRRLRRGPEKVAAEKK